MTLLGERPRPSVAIVGPDAANLADSLRGTFPTLIECEYWSWLESHIHPKEVDIIVATTNGGLRDPEGKQYLFGPHIVLFAEQAFFPGHQGWTLIGDGEAQGTAFRVGENVHPLLYPLTVSWAAQLGDARRRRITLDSSAFDFDEHALLSSQTPKGAMALVYEREVEGRRRGVAWLPNAPRQAEWVLALTQVWADNIVGAVKWQEREEYLTERERKAKARLVEIRQRRQSLIAQLAEQEASAQREMSEAAIEASNGPRRLLTTQDSELVGCVADVLRDMGFDVRDMDREKKPGESKLEDLRISPPDDSSWVALVEVRGYEKRSANMADIKRLGRHARIYTKETGNEPAKLIYVVNGQFQLPPDSPSRHRPFHSDRDAVQELQADGELVVDTRDLFNLHQRLPEIGAEEARRQLMEQAGVFKVQMPQPGELKETG